MVWRSHGNAFSCSGSADRRGMQLPALADVSAPLQWVAPIMAIRTALPRSIPDAPPCPASPPPPDAPLESPLPLPSRMASPFLVLLRRGGAGVLSDRSGSCIPRDSFSVLTMAGPPSCVCGRGFACRLWSSATSHSANFNCLFVTRISARSPSIAAVIPSASLCFDSSCDSSHVTCSSRLSRIASSEAQRAWISVSCIGEIHFCCRSGSRRVGWGCREAFGQASGRWTSADLSKARQRKSQGLLC